MSVIRIINGRVTGNEKFSKLKQTIDGFLHWDLSIWAYLRIIRIVYFTTITTMKMIAPTTAPTMYHMLTEANEV